MTIDHSNYQQLGRFLFFALGYISAVSSLCGELRCATVFNLTVKPAMTEKTHFLARKKERMIFIFLQT